MSVIKKNLYSSFFFSLPSARALSLSLSLSLSYSLDEARHGMWLSDAGVCLVRRLLPGAVPAAVAACL